MITTERFSTADVDPSERLARWTQVVSASCGKHSIDPHPTAEFGGVLLRRSYGDLCVTRVANSAPATIRGEEVGSSRREPEHAVLALQDIGSSVHALEGKLLPLATGTAALHAGPFVHSFSFAEPSRFVLLKFPAARLAARAGSLARFQTTRIEVTDAALLTGFLRTLLARDDAATEAGWGDAISDVVLDLIALTCSRIPASAAGHRTPRSTTGERWQRTVRDFVDRHLGDPALGPAMIADQLGVSPRYVQMVFAGMATTVTAYVLAKRLELAAQLLISGHHSVIEVAARSGFLDRSYFYRSFRKRFGVSPRCYATQRAG